MSADSTPPDFRAFTRWVARRFGSQALKLQVPEHLLAAARAARDAAQTADATTSARANMEVLELLAAASTDEAGVLPELTTPLGFRVTLAFDGVRDDPATTIGVLVRCPPSLLNNMKTQTPYLWSGDARYQLGQFDVDGKAFGTLPTQVRITVSDFMQGKVKLEVPGLRAAD